MARLYVADKETLDAVKADTTGILKQLQDADGKFSNIKRYGIKINKADSNPDTRITYLYDAAGFTPAKMNFTDGSFDFGSWGEVFFVKQNRPVMLKADRTVAYELNHTDHSKKLDGKIWWSEFTSFEEELKGADQVKSTFLSEIGRMFEAALTVPEIAGIIINPWNRTIMLDKHLIRIIMPD